MLDKNALKTGIADAFKANISGITADQAAEVDTMAAALAGHIDTYVKGIVLTYTAGLVAPSGGGPVTGTLTYTVS